MKATWITSSLGGVLIAVILHALEREGEKASMSILAPLFFIVMIVGVIGLPQLRDWYAERKRRGLGYFGVMAARQDFNDFYFPTWGRMFVWFGAFAVTVLILKTWLP